MTTKHLDFSPLEHYVELPPPEMLERARAFRDELRRRRTVRHFSDRPIAREVIERCLEAAASAPSGANQQPWHFSVVSNPAVKREIRQAAEEEERTFYRERAPQAWLDVLALLGTDENKPFLEIAPYLIVVFAQLRGVDADGAKFKHYYVNESVGIATGMLICALHHAGLATLTHTPSPMRFLNEILERPAHERPYLILVTGYPAADALVPRIKKKTLAQIARFID
ncbi:MAG: nitroreductase family protein [Acidobacteria bacterium]|nr:nitroreductase family protein [Acidobacteriota bacterium]